jgi:uncharacterized RDD family membrane protein YckC
LTSHCGERIIIDVPRRQIATLSAPAVRPAEQGMSMRLICPHCHDQLEFSDKRPLFCGFCGHALPPAPALPATGADPGGIDPDLPGAGTDSVPQEIGGYQLVRLLGEGGMGEVWEAEEPASGRRVALKLLKTEFAPEETAVERFRQEGRLASRLAHPRCVFVLAADEDAGRPYIVMELMPGRTLEDLVQTQGPLPVEQAVAVILDVIDGLREAHRLGLVHRDVKPSNCFLQPDGRVKIGDFGLARSLLSAGRLTQPGTFLGTPLFASPEQVRQEEVDFRTDVYGVAAALYYLLTGRTPFEADDYLGTMARILSSPPTPLRAWRPELPEELEQVVLRGLERDRRRRWRDLESLEAALLPFAEREPVPGSLGLRFAAFPIDLLAIMVFGIIVNLMTVYVAGRAAFADPWFQLAFVPITMMIWLTWYVLLEGAWGCSLGKWILGLRVRQTGGRRRPAFARILLRTAMWVVLVALPWDSGRVGLFLAQMGYLPITPVSLMFIGLFIPLLSVCSGLAIRRSDAKAERLSGFARVRQWHLCDQHGTTATPGAVASQAGAVSCAPPVLQGSAGPDRPLRGPGGSGRPGRRTAPAGRRPQTRPSRLDSAPHRRPRVTVPGAMPTRPTWSPALARWR